MQRGDAHLHLLADVDRGDSGTGRIRRSWLFSERRTSGSACVDEAVPACSMVPVSANRLVMTPANGAVTRV